MKQSRDERRSEHALTLWREKRAHDLAVMRWRAERQLEAARTKYEGRQAFAAECATQTPQQRRALLAQLAARERAEKARSKRESAKHEGLEAA